MYRAVYSKADVVLLDDPLSAVDTKVGRHIFDEVITGLLKDSVVILVTHQVQFLAPATEILVLEAGSVRARGKFDELRKAGDLVGLKSDPDSIAATAEGGRPQEMASLDELEGSEDEAGGKPIP